MVLKTKQKEKTYTYSNKNVLCQRYRTDDTKNKNRNTKIPTSDLRSTMHCHFNSGRLVQATKKILLKTTKNY